MGRKNAGALLYALNVTREVSASASEICGTGINWSSTNLPARGECVHKREIARVAAL